MMANIEIYTTSTCPYCDRAKQLLQRYQAPYTEINISADTSKRDEMVKRSHGRQTVPQIFINNQHVGGCDDLYALHHKNALKTLLGL